MQQPNHFWFSKILSELKELKQQMQDSQPIDGWVNKRHLMKFLDLSKTGVYYLEKKQLLEAKCVGKRKFYSVESIKKLILKNNK
jgi:hypothetical protein